ncbi:uncharacterized protein METZ01_LOCUS475111, partial [marine metagenome]
QPFGPVPVGGSHWRACVLVACAGTATLWSSPSYGGNGM